MQPPIRTPLPPRLASFYPLSAWGLQLSPTENKGKAPAVAIDDEFSIDVEFENAWETTSDWNEDDDEVVQEENVLCFPDDFTVRKERDLDITMESG